jgi:hypothetical protein
MTTVYRLAGYDRRTGRLGVMHDVPDSKVEIAKELAGVARDHDGMGAYPLDASQAHQIAVVIGAQINIDACDFLFEPFAEEKKRKTGFFHSLLGR